MLARKGDAKKLLVSVLLIALVCSPVISMALATPDAGNAQAPDSSAATDDGQTLYASEDNVTTSSNDDPMLIQPREDNSTTNGDSSAIPTESGESNDENSLIATQTGFDNTAAIVLAVCLAVMVAIGAGVVVFCRRKK